MSLSRQIGQNRDIYNLGRDEFLGRDFLGKVVDNQDPEKKGRCKINVFGVFDNLATEDLPWAYPRLGNIFGQDGLSGQISIPKNGAILKVTFDNQDIYCPEYHFHQELAKDVKDQLQSEYDGTHIFCFDGDVKLKMYYTTTKGLTFELDESKVNILPDNSIVLEHKGTQSMIELKGGIITINSSSQVNTTAGSSIHDISNEIWTDGATVKIGHIPQYKAVLGEPLFILLRTLAEIIDTKMNSTPGLCVNLTELYKIMALSDTVKVSK